MKSWLKYGLEAKRYSSERTVAGQFWNKQKGSPLGVGAFLLAGPTGLEPAIFGLTGRYVLHLHHGPYCLEETKFILPYIRHLSSPIQLNTQSIQISGGGNSASSDIGVHALVIEAKEAYDNRT